MGLTGELVFCVSVILYLYFVFIYSQAVVADRTVYISGVIGIDPKTDKLVEGGAVAEARQIMINMGNILNAAGSNYKNG